MTSTDATPLTQLCALIPQPLLADVEKSFDAVTSNARKYTFWSHVVHWMLLQLEHAQSLRELADHAQRHADQLAQLNVKAMRRTTFANNCEVRDHRMFEALFKALLAYYSPQLPTPLVNVLRRKALDDVEADVVSLAVKLLPTQMFACTKGKLFANRTQSFTPDVWVYRSQPDTPEFSMSQLTQHQIQDPLSSLSIPAMSFLFVDVKACDDALLRSIIHWTCPFLIRVQQAPMWQTSTPLHEQKSMRYGWTYSEVTLPVRAVPGLRSQANPASQATKLYHIRYHDYITTQTIQFITNQGQLQPDEILRFVCQREEVARFYQKLYDSLTTKTLIGLSENAVMGAHWTSLMVALLKNVWALKRRHPTLWWRGYAQSVMSAQRAPKVLHVLTEPVPTCAGGQAEKKATTDTASEATSALDVTTSGLVQGSLLEELLREVDAAASSQHAQTSTHQPVPRSLERVDQLTLF